MANTSNNHKSEQGKDNKKTKEENSAREKNTNWDQAQRRQQASPRGYNVNLEEENIENQNTRAGREQSDKEKDIPKKGKVGDKASERQQSRGEEN